MEQVIIPVSVVDTISATLWEVPEAKAVVILHPATAVRQDFYHDFAGYLSEHGFSVITYDYRGIGRSRCRNMRDYNVSMADWMEEDVGRVTDWAASRFNGRLLLAVGHSVGGHAITLSSATRALHAAVLVASHAGVTGTIQNTREKFRVWCVMRLLAPILCRLFGYMPARRLGMGEDLPAAVMLQWSRWSSLPDYFYDDPQLNAKQRAGQVDIPLLVMGFDDDPWANPDAISRLLHPLKQAVIERHYFRHSEVGIPAIGHMGFFRKRCAEALWPVVGDWLAKQSDMSRSQA